MNPTITGLEPLFAALDPKKAKLAQREISRYLRRQWVKRIRGQVDVHGQAFTPRLARNENRKMLQGFASPTRLLARYRDDGFSIGYAGKAAERAEVHNLGLVDRIRSRSGLMVDAVYPAREWVGINAADEMAIKSILARYMSA